MKNKREIEFLKRLADLLEEFDVDITGKEWAGWDGGGCDGIEIETNFMAPYDENREKIAIELPKSFDAEDIRKYHLDKEENS